MMKLITMIFLGASICMAAETNGPAYKLAEYYSSGQIKRGALWTNGAPTRTFFEWYPNGQMHIQMEMKPQSSGGHGWRTEWNEDGFLVTKTLYRDGTAIRTVQFREHSNLPESASDTLANSILEYYPNGILRYEATNTRGLGVGRLFEWYDDGRQRRAWHYLDGKPHGVCLQWHANGIKMEERVYRFGELEELNYWNEKGEPAQHPDVDIGG